MRCYFFLSIFFFSVHFCLGQDISVNEVLEHCNKKLNTITAISYTMNHEMKYAMTEDIFTNKIQCVLKKDLDDKIGGNHNIWVKSEERQQVYNRKKLMNINHASKSAIIVNPKEQGYQHYQQNNIRSFALKYIFEEKVFLDFMTSDKVGNLGLVDDENINDALCHVVRIEMKDGSGVSDYVILLKIRKNDFMLVGQEISMKFEGFIQYEKMELNDIKLNKDVSDAYFDLEKNTPQQFEIIEYVKEEKKEIKLLEKGVEVPSLNGLNLRGEKVTWADFEGEIIVLDFWFKQCYPCRKSIPDLQFIQEKYKDKGVTVLGVNVEDDSDLIKAYVKEHSITYPNIEASAAMAESYQVPYFPTIYIIGSDGKIVAGFAGYGDDLRMDIVSAIEDLIR